VSTPSSKHLVLIGAGPGLGAAVAHRFGREGFRVTLVARREAALAELADALRATGSHADTVVADASDADAFRHELQRIAERSEPDVVVYNAALLASDNILTSDSDYLARAYAVDVLGAVTAAQVFTPAMRRNGAGTFLTTGGGFALQPHPDYATVSVGKAALRAVTALLHDELKTDGVHVTGITVAGNIAPETPFAPDRIAETYWALRGQPDSHWTPEVLFDGQNDHTAAG
jgi:short-subunit dehydrogenase